MAKVWPIYGCFETDSLTDSQISAVLANGTLLEAEIKEINVGCHSLSALRKSSAAISCSEATACLNKSRIRTGGAQGNQIHSSTLWTLGFLKMYMGTLGYLVLIIL